MKDYKLLSIAKVTWLTVVFCTLAACANTSHFTASEEYEVEEGAYEDMQKKIARIRAFSAEQEKKGFYDEPKND